MLIYPAVFEKGSKYFIVKFPDVPEAMTQGETLEEAYEMANEVLGAALEDYTEYPQPSNYDTIKELHHDKIVSLIGIDMIAYRRKYHSKTIRKNVTVPEWIVDLATVENINFSQTLTEALKSKLGVS